MISIMVARRYCKVIWNRDGTHPPKVKHVHQNGDIHQVYPPTDVAVSQHDQALAELQARLLREAQPPVRLQDLLQLTSVDFRGVFHQEFG